MRHPEVPKPVPGNPQGLVHQPRRAPRPVLALLACALLAGCTAESSSWSDVTHSKVQHCVNGVCRECVDGECTGPLQDLYDEAAQRHADVEVQESVDLSNGLPETGWTFWVDPNATGHVVLRVVDHVTGEHAVLPSLCFSWERWLPSSWSSGGSGACGSGSNIAIQGGDLEGRTLADWQQPAEGRYRLTVSSAQPQPHHIVVDIVIDNP